MSTTAYLHTKLSDRCLVQDIASLARLGVWRDQRPTVKLADTSHTTMSKLGCVIRCILSGSIANNCAISTFSAASIVGSLPPASVILETW
jgi:hypothetical protein